MCVRALMSLRVCVCVCVCVSLRVCVCVCVTFLCTGALSVTQPPVVQLLSPPDLPTSRTVTAGCVARRRLSESLPGTRGVGSEQ